MTELESQSPETVEESGVGLTEAREMARQLQQEMPFAVVSGKTMTQLPLDLYIPPDALEVFLDAFEGPLDLLLYLIKKQNLDVLEINVFEITRQYMEYVELMRSLNLELAADYLVMAAMLAEIKSRILLPRNTEEGEEDEEDPRAELIRRLQEYEQFKQAAEDLDQVYREGRDFFTRESSRSDHNTQVVYQDIEMRELVLAFREILLRADMFIDHQISRETLSTRERMSEVLDRLRDRAFVPFVSLFKPAEGKLGVVVTFLAVMELCKEGLVELLQHEIFGPIHVKAKTDAITENESGEYEQSE
ncbi:segregation and condensation protein A [Gynuella sunshinyii]|uniref:Segregation and condensation protein A n=1 Tax=Gynuella sunshinyii YC6258 TaxID=1445510 RepID=A0A0C5VSZ7_9GAMM|nr:hypothetical protein YC6258_04431 [Gynuella sunshinyii YC6258]